MLSVLRPCTGLLQWAVELSECSGTVYMFNLHVQRGDEAATLLMMHHGCALASGRLRAFHPHHKAVQLQLLVWDMAVVTTSKAACLHPEDATA